MKQDYIPSKESWERFYQESQACNDIPYRDGFIIISLWTRIKDDLWTITVGCTGRSSKVKIKFDWVLPEDPTSWGKHYDVMVRLGPGLHPADETAYRTHKEAEDKGKALIDKYMGIIAKYDNWRKYWESRPVQ